MAIVTYFHILAELLTVLEESFESKELLPKNGHKAILPSIYFRKNDICTTANASYFVISFPCDYCVQYPFAHLFKKIREW